MYHKPVAPSIIIYCISNSKRPEMCFISIIMQMRRERFVEELEGYSRQLEEFQTFGDMQEIQRYLKKAQALNQRLESAADKV